MEKGLNFRYGGYWKLEKVFFNESVSTILQLQVVVSLQVRYFRQEYLGIRASLP